MPNNDIEKFISCDCHSDEHTLRFNLIYSDDGSPELYTSVYLHQYRGFWKRVWVAIKYVFGYNCKYGHWDCFSANEEKIKELKAFLRKIK